MNKKKNRFGARAACPRCALGSIPRREAHAVVHTGKDRAMVLRGLWLCFAAVLPASFGELTVSEPPAAAPSLPRAGV